MLMHLLATAQGGTIDVAALAAAAVGDARQDTSSWIGAHGAIEATYGPRLAVGGRVLGGAGLGTVGPVPPVVMLESTLRVWAAEPRRGLSGVVGAGLQLQSTLGAVVSLGTSLDLRPVPRGPRPRIDAGYHFVPRDGSWRLSLSVGAVWGERPAVAPVPVVAEPEAPEPRRVGAGLVWVPQPVCDWVTPEELATVPSLRAEEANATPVPWVTMGAEPVPSVPPSLVVAAWPGDEVRVSGEAVDVSEDGVATVQVSEGTLDLEVRGGGRAEVFTLAVSEGHALWVTAQLPKPIRVRFDVAVAELDDEARAALRDAIAHRGDWTLEVRGSHSPEGDAAVNQALARARAERVARFLREEGVPADRVVLSENLDVEEAASPPEALRAAVVYPTQEAP